MGAHSPGQVLRSAEVPAAAGACSLSPTGTASARHLETDRAAGARCWNSDPSGSGSSRSPISWPAVRGGSCAGRTRSRRTVPRRRSGTSRCWRATAPPLLPFLAAAGARIDGLRLRDGTLIVKIERGGRSIQIRVENDTPLLAGGGIRIWQEVGKDLGVSLARASGLLDLLAWACGSDRRLRDDRDTGDRSLVSAMTWRRDPRARCGESPGDTTFAGNRNCIGLACCC